MTQDIIAMAREAGFQSAEFWPDDFKGLMGCVQRFAELVAKETERKASFDRAELWLKRINDAVLAEREACALVCETDGIGAKYQGDVYAEAIRARGQA